MVSSSQTLAQNFYLGNMRNEYAGQAHLPLFIIFLYLTFSPIYVFPSGMPQPADVLMGIGILWWLQSAYKQQFTISRFFLAGLLFVSLTTTINLLNYIFFPHIRFIFSSLYIIYNFAALGFMTYLFKRYPDSSKKFIYAGLVIAIAYETYFAAYGLRPSYRAIGTFDNPNQLAYWGLLMAAVLVLLKYNERFTLPDYILFIALGFIQTQALSKAGLITFGLFVSILPFLPQVSKKAKFIVVFFLVIFSIFFLRQPGLIESLANNIEVVSSSIARLENIGHEGDDSAAGRGYDRIVNYPEYLLLGAGEGAYYRFHPMGKNSELHSGLATILFSYGILGFGLFLTFLALLFKNRPQHFWALLFIILLFGITHQNIRFTHFWLFLALAHSAVFMNMPRIKEIRKTP